MRITLLEYGSLLCYCPHPDSKEMGDAYDAMIAVKNDDYLENPSIQMSQWIAETVQHHLSKLPFKSFFQPESVLVPVPKSSLMKPDTLWAPRRIAAALVARGLGREMSACLVRIKPVTKSATAKASERPKPREHFESMSIQGTITDPREILLIDDIVTRGSTLLGAANRITTAFPNARIRAFAAMAAISKPNDFVALYKPLVGTIQYRPAKEDTLRRP